jgi:ABC-2 type transport system permease protein
MIGSWLLLVRNQGLGFLREPPAVVFNLALPLFIVIVQAFAYGDQLVGKDLPGYRVVDVLPVGACITFTGIIGLFGAAVGLASMVEARTLASFRFRPGGVASLVLAYGLVLVALMVLGVVVSWVVLALGWSASAPRAAVAVTVTVLVAAVGFTGLGASIAALVSSARAAQAVASAVFFPMLFLSGAFMPLSAFPPGLRAVGEVLPGAHFNDVLSWAWVRTDPPSWIDVGYLVALVALPMAFALVRFRSREDL